MVTLFAVDQLTIMDSEYSLQKEVHELYKDYNLQISSQETKIMAFKGNKPINSKIIVNN